GVRRQRHLSHASRHREDALAVDFRADCGLPAALSCDGHVGLVDTPFSCEEGRESLPFLYLALRPCSLLPSCTHLNRRRVPRSKPFRPPSRLANTCAGCC